MITVFSLIEVLDRAKRGEEYQTPTVLNCWFSVSISQESTYTCTLSNSSGYVICNSAADVVALLHDIENADDPVTVWRRACEKSYVSMLEKSTPIKPIRREPRENPNKRINRASKTVEFHGMFVPKGAFYGVDNGIPYITKFEKYNSGTYHVMRFKHGKWYDKKERNDLTRDIWHILVREKRESDRRIYADSHCTYTSMSEIKNPSGYVHFT